MGECVSAFEQLLQERCLLRPADFNLFRLLRAEDELVHSRFIAWLIDPLAEHHQGDLFLQTFASLVGLTPFSVGVSGVAVRTEFPVVEARVDIMACRPGDFLIFVENKLFAQEGDGQVERELRDMHRAGAALSVPEAHRCAVFLTPSGRAPVSGDPSAWRAVSYAELATAFAGKLREVTDAKVRSIVEDWICLVQNWR